MRGRKEKMEGRIEVREGAGKGEDLREWKWSKEAMVGGFGMGAIATQGEREGEEVRKEEGGGLRKERKRGRDSREGKAAKK